MNWRIPLTAFAVGTTFFLPGVPSIAQTSSVDKYRVLAKEEVGLSLQTVEAFIKDGDKLFRLKRLKMHWKNINQQFLPLFMQKLLPVYVNQWKGLASYVKNMNVCCFWTQLLH